MTLFKQITVDEVQKLIDHFCPVIIDIRDKASFELGHIQGALHLNDENLEEFIQSSDLTRPLVCYCYHGVSSQAAAQFFINHGFKNVYSLIGGYEAWNSKNQ